ncbi:MAG: hypothetical protein N2C14_26495, partial [Planctomycetales bacterium]
NVVNNITAEGISVFNIGSLSMLGNTITDTGGDAALNVRTVAGDAFIQTTTIANTAGDGVFMQDVTGTSTFDRGMITNVGTAGGILRGHGFQAENLLGDLILTNTTINTTQSLEGVLIFADVAGVNADYLIENLTFMNPGHPDRDMFLSVEQGTIRADRLNVTFSPGFANPASLSAGPMADLTVFSDNLNTSMNIPNVTVSPVRTNNLMAPDAP